MIPFLYQAAGQAGSEQDRYYSSVSTLLLFTGPDASTTIICAKGKSYTASGNAQIDTAQYKFNGSSLLLDGTGDYVSSAHHADFNIESGDFTLEAWVYRAASGVSHYLASKRPSGATSNGWEWRINSTNKFQYFHTGGSSLISTVDVPSGAWAHIATCRSGGTAYHFVNGAAAGSGAFANGTVNNADSLKVGVDSTLATGFNGWIGAFRMTKGVARYTAAFTPPTAPFPTS